MADTMMSFTDNKLSTHFLSDSELRSMCPMAFKTSPTNPNVSNKYVQANTSTVIDDMAKLGWYPVEAKQRRARANSSGIHSYHMIAFQNPDIKVVANGEDEAYPRIILTNSHDGFNSFKFMMGIFRLVCSNGLIVATETYGNFAIRHINYTFEDLRHLVNKTVKELPGYIEIMNSMKAKTLNKTEKYDMALKMLRIRKNVDANETLNVSEQTLTNILTPVRDADKGDSLWSVFNVLQEKMIKGGEMVESGRTDKLRKMRPVKSFVSDMNINYKMFEVAREYLEAA